jgi:hypothetical protein
MITAHYVGLEIPFLCVQDRTAAEAQPGSAHMLPRKRSAYASAVALVQNRTYPSRAVKSNDMRTSGSAIAQPAPVCRILENRYQGDPLDRMGGIPTTL